MMTTYSYDVTYAYIQLGLEAGSSLQTIEGVLTHALAYRFSSKKRIQTVRKFVAFFVARHKFGDINISFNDIRKAYHQKAMALHPDRNLADKEAEDQLKDINTAYALVEEINRHAKDYFAQNESMRADSAQQARQTTDREKPHEMEEDVRSPVSSESNKSTSQPKPEPTPREAPHGVTIKYMAASLPRSIRTSRLSYLLVKTIIGSRVTKQANDLNIVFDIIMLPEKEFLRAKSYLAVPSMMSVHLQYGKFDPPYILRDIKEILISTEDTDPEASARDYFRKEFLL